MNIQLRSVDFKYNPGFKEDRDLQNDFIVRKRELKLLLDVIRGNHGASSNRHVLLIGPRGAGKTTLARRIAAELRLEPELSTHWFPIVFGEESYAVSSVGEFWLECVYHLQKALNSDVLERRYLELREIQNDDALLDAAIATIIDHARGMGRRFLLIVENLNVLLEVQMSTTDAWSFRHTLQNHPEIMLLATATSSFDQIESDELALFEQFKVHHVGPLSVKDCRLLWYKVSGERLQDQQVRPIQILTGGNPRLIRILAEFALDNVFYQLVNKLAFMIDQYTDYFKSQLDLLPSAERKVFVALLELWDPSITREVAQVARVSTNTAGSYLDRLEKRGAVTKEGSYWQAAERLFNIYYLMRRRGAPSSRVQALVRFMTVYYAPDQLVTRVRELAAEACHLKPSERQDHYYAVSALVTQFAPGEQRSVLSSFPRDFFLDPNLPPPIAKLRMTFEEVASSVSMTSKAGKTASASRANEIRRLKEIAELIDAGDRKAVEALSAQFVEESGGSVTALYTSAAVNASLGRGDLAEEDCRRALAVDPAHAPAWSLLTQLLLDADRTNEALEAARELTRLDATDASHWNLLGRAAEAASEDSAVVEAAYRQALEIDPNRQEALVGLAKVVAEIGNLVQAKELYERAVGVEPLHLSTIGQYGDFLAEVVDDDEAAERIFREITERFADRSTGWTRLAIHVGSDSGRRTEARQLFETATALADGDARPWVAYAQYLNLIGEVSDAAAAWRQATDLDSDSPELWLMFARFSAHNDLVTEAEQAFVRSIELDPDDARAWEQLGSFLLSETERFKEAEAAFNEAMQKAPDSCSPVHSLGRLYEKQGRFEEADAQYRRALELRPECGCAIEDLLSARTHHGRDLPDAERLVATLLERYPASAKARVVNARYLRFAKADLAGAKAQLVLALGFEDAGIRAWEETAEVLVDSSSDPKGIERELLGLIQQHTPCQHILNQIAWSLHSKYGSSVAPVAIAIARQASERDPDSWDICHTLASVLVDAGDLDGALAVLPRLLSTYTEREFAPLIELVIGMARSGEHTVTCLLGAIEAAGQGVELEPLAVALRMARNETVHVAKEVLEVAKDICEQIGKSPVLH